MGKMRKVGVTAFTYMSVYLSRLGELTGQQWLIYHPLVRYYFDLVAKRNSLKLVEAVSLVFPSVRRIADVGCGSGRYAAEFQKQGMDVSACEYGASLRRRAKRNGVTKLYRFNLAESAVPMPGAPFDLAICLEVAEHIDERFADKLVDYLVSTAPCIWFTAAPPGQGGTGHVNEQLPKYWIAKFESRGAKYDCNRSRLGKEVMRAAKADHYLADNLMIFARSA